MTGSPEPAHPKPRLVGLDVLRFFAVSLVLHIHALQGFGPIQAWRDGGVLNRLLELLPPGMRGVDIFFVLSGFLVSGLFFQELARTGTISPGRFLIRRGFKIYPAFWFLIAITVLLQFRRTGQVNGAGLAAELLFFQNYTAGLWPHTWTLAVEEHFYVLLACLFLLLKRFPATDGRINLKVIPRVADAVILLCFGARILTWWFGDSASGDNQRWFVSVTHIRLDALFFGVWLAHWWYHGSDPGRRTRVLSFRWLWLLAGLVLISPINECVMGVEAWRIFGFISAYLGAGCLLLAALSLDYFRCPVWAKWPAWLGRHSYSVYLWHLLVRDGLEPMLGTTSASAGIFLGKGVIYFAACWAFGIIMARIVEIPALRLRDRLFPTKN